MLDKTGVCYVAFGARARIEAAASINTLRKHNGFPVSVICSRPFDSKGVNTIIMPDAGPGARWAKLNVDILAPYDRIIYLDADTRIHADLMPAVKMLDFYDLVLAPSANQGAAMFQHIEERERRLTLDETANPMPLQFQAGVLMFNRVACNDLFAAWRAEWERFRDKDQAAFVRAFHRHPVKTWLLGLDWNSEKGSIIEHQFGKAR